MNYMKDKEETDTYIFLGDKRPKNKKFDSNIAHEATTSKISEELSKII